jgi:hypothetical protein
VVTVLPDPARVERRRVVSAPARSFRDDHILELPHPDVILFGNHPVLLGEIREIISADWTDLDASRAGGV